MGDFGSTIAAYFIIKITIFFGLIYMFVKLLPLIIIGYIIIVIIGVLFKQAIKFIFKEDSNKLNYDKK